MSGEPKPWVPGEPVPRPEIELPVIGVPDRGYANETALAVNSGGDHEILLDFLFVEGEDPTAVARVALSPRTALGLHLLLGKNLDTTERT